MAPAELCDSITAPNCHPLACAARSGSATFVSGASGYEQHAFVNLPSSSGQPVAIREDTPDEVVRH